MSENNPREHVIMMMLDTLMDEPLQRALEEESLPAFQFFMEKANHYYPDVVAPFPTMSVNVESTFITGHYSDQHHIPALAWFNQKEQRIINYGTHVIEQMKLGLSRCVYDTFYRLNNEHLNPNVTTIYEDLYQEGKTAASVNALVYRGPVENELKLPRLLRLFVPLDRTIPTKGPSHFVYGKFSKMSPWTKYSHVWNKYGFNNHFSIQEFTYFVEQDMIPHFSIVYLPDHDKRVHKHGRMDLKGIKQMDEQLQQLLNAFSSWEEALERNIWILMGDNGQATVGENKEQALVDLRRLLEPWKITKLRKGVQPDDQIVLGMNLRSCFVYSLHPDVLPLDEIAKKLQSDARIEVIAWKEQEWIHVISGDKQGTLRFKENGNVKDVYEQMWTIEGDTTVLDLNVNGSNLSFGEYPDALKRLHSCLHSHDGDYVVCATKPGHEFIGESTPHHENGASHGGFHNDDSLIPLLVAGTESQPPFLRIVDLKTWILQLTRELKERSE
ncbi:alkaline phosphatase family protein [Halalkalibacterium halodurans]|uniref:alkaline phosphatase family protein n=1 Tax=Halalkalibacterium halodurans TaxID=86665 RepID=UPI002E230D53|nr:alkaline phosphatase family protein [Halalkalibacterium halodurans]MED4085913.1 alkaline phosphatase family protein [Halalkalibacterium halodurans]MED4104007.1 alkaline phosphatase family protein [Halalkalibacterium halodurans]MED4109842.1 alkaline phosphatase family protein [Halalkalibacterium halodurans]MED4149392.1 alkaline phosphatase family protein [Halalkalibacterium halodurans]